MQRNASAHWTGGLKDGKGTLTAPGGVLKNTPYSFHTRFESEPGTNPEVGVWTFKVWEEGGATMGWLAQGIGVLVIALAAFVTMWWLVRK